MARFAFGGEITQLVVTPDAGNANALVVAPNQAVVFKVAIAGATATDFLLWDGSAYTTVATSISSNAAGILPRFQGPDGLKYLFSQATDGSWVRLTANDLEAETSFGSATDGQYLKKVSGSIVGDTLTADDVADGTTNKAFLATERTKLTGIATGATANDTDANLKNRANHTGTVTLASMASDEADYAKKTGSITQMADVADTAPSDLMVLAWDADTGSYVPTDLFAIFAKLGVDGRLDPSQNPRWFLPETVVIEGDAPQAGFPVGGLVNAKPATASVIPVLLGTQHAQPGSALVITTTQDVEVGEYVLLSVGTSGEATLPSTYTITYSVGVCPITSAVVAQNAANAQDNILYGKCTTRIPSGSTITITANQARAQFAAQAFKVAGLVSSSALDQTVAGTGANNTTLTKTVGTTAATAQANELAFMSYCYNSGAGSLIRTIAGANGWTQLTPATEAESGSARSVATFYKTLSAIGAVSGDVVIDSTTDGNAGPWAGCVATFKVA